MDSRLLTEDGWKDVLKKSPTLKDNGLQKTLAAYEQLDDKEHADQREIAKAKVLAEKTQALAAKTEAKKEDAGEEDEEEETGQADLKTALQGVKTAKKPY